LYELMTTKHVNKFQSSIIAFDLVLNRIK